VGRIGAPHGVGGRVKLQSFMEIPQMLGDLGPLSDATASRIFRIALISHVKDHAFIGAIEGIRSRAEAELLTNTFLFVHRSRLPELQPEEFYHVDLIGMEVVETGGKAIGRVSDVLDFGAGSILEVKRPQGDDVLLPFTRKVVLAVQMEKRTLVVDLPVETSGYPD
jgi:16S rRNA processing protein RimM